MASMYGDKAPEAVEPSWDSSTSTYASSSRGSFLFAPFRSVSERFSAWRDALNLPDPGLTDCLGREAKNVQLGNYAFDGARAELSKTISPDPLFQIANSFTFGGQGGPMGGISPGTWNLTTLYTSLPAATHRLLQGSFDNEGNVQARLHQSWSAKDSLAMQPSYRNIAKVTVQIPPSSGSPSMFTLDYDRVGRDYTASFKAVNPSPTDFSGAYVASYLQSITPSLALGVEGVLQRQAPDTEEAAVGYMVKYTGKDWIATGHAMAQGLYQATYWRKLAELNTGVTIDGGVDLTLVPASAPGQRKAVATAAIKHDFRAASFRGQVDSSGKVGMYLEQRFSNAFGFLISGEIDHVKNTSKVGIGIQLETSPLKDPMM